MDLIIWTVCFQTLRPSIKSLDLLIDLVIELNSIEYVDKKLNPYFGGIVGRVANRISNAEFRLGDKVYKLVKNDGENCLHSGPESFHWVGLRH